MEGLSKHQRFELVVTNYKPLMYLELIHARQRTHSGFRCADRLNNLLKPT
jgi:hypothetical protein